MLDHSNTVQSQSLGRRMVLLNSKPFTQDDCSNLSHNGRGNAMFWFYFHSACQEFEKFYIMMTMFQNGLTMNFFICLQNFHSYIFQNSLLEIPVSGISIHPVKDHLVTSCLTSLNHLAMPEHSWILGDY